MNKFIKKTFNSFITSFYLVSQLIFPIMVAQPVSAAPPPPSPTITATDHEGQLDPAGTYSNGNITQYSELESINFRFTLTSTGANDDAKDHRMKVEFTQFDGFCNFWDGTFNLGTHDASAAAVVNVSGDTPVVTKVGAPAIVSGEWVQTLDVDFDAAGTAVVNYYLTLTGDAGACNGSSQHSRLANAPVASRGDFSNIGAQNVPVPAKDILVLPDITVFKSVDTDGDGITDRPALANEWSFSLDGATPVPLSNPVAGLVFENVTDGPHTITETGPDGYTHFGEGGSCVGQVVDGVWSFNIVVTNDTANQTCNFWNQAQPEPVDPTVTVVKEVIGGDATPSDFTLFLNQEALASGDVYEAEAGVDYFLGESFVTDYQQTSVVCTDNSDTADIPTALDHDPLVLGEDQHVTCVWTNTYHKPVGHVTVTKMVNNNDGGDATANDFELFVNDTKVVSGDKTEFDAGVEYDITEKALVDGYKHTGTSCYLDLPDADVNPVVEIPFTLEANQHVVCKVNNADLPAYITVYKNVVNDDGREATADQFQLYVDDVAVDQGSKERYKVDKTHYITEDQLDNYDLQSIVCVDATNDNAPVDYPVDLELGQHVKCVVNNNDQPIRSGTVTVNKIVKNDDGGTLENTDFPLFVGKTHVMHGDSNSFAPGLYEISEFQQEGYTKTGIRCFDSDLRQAIDHPFILGEDQNVVCNVYNDDRPARVTVYKNVINDDGGRSTPANFDLFINETEVTHNTAVTMNGNLWVTINEAPTPGYEQISIRCVDLTADQTVDFYFRTENGHNYRCVITNDDVPPTLTVYKRVVNDNGGTLGSDDFELWVNQRSVDHGETNNVRANYWLNVSETEQDGYEHLSTRCRLVGSDSDLERPFKLRPGQDAECLLVNDDIAPVVVIEKNTFPYFSDQMWNFRVRNNGEIVQTEAPIRLDTAPWTDYSNSYEVEDLSAGRVTITERQVDGWISAMQISCTYGHYYENGDVGINGDLPFETVRMNNRISFNAEIGDVIVCQFLNVEKGDVKVTKFHDTNENGYWDKSEPTLPNWEMNLDAYRMRPCNDGPIGPVILGAQLHGDENAANCGETVHALNGFDYERTPDKSWSQTTGEDGMTTFEDVWPTPLAQYELSETDQLGWHQTNIYCEPGRIIFPTDDVSLVSDVRQISLPGYGGSHDGTTNVMVFPGETTECFVGNTYDPALTIEKFNDQPTPTQTGEEVEYTIVVTVPEDSGCVYRDSYQHEFPFPWLTREFDEVRPFPVMMRGCGAEMDYEESETIVSFGSDIQICFEGCDDDELGEVTVTDLPPEGFEYVPGSWTANSSVRGDLKASGITTEPGYASPGRWFLTSPASPFLVPGETVTLTYNALIDDAVTNGVYPDNAFVEGYTQDGEKIFGNLHFSSTPFVGTEVEVLALSPDTGGFVLGVLANTGVPAILTPLAGVLITAGALLLGRTNRKQRRIFKRLGSSMGAMFAGLALSFVFSASVFAAGFWTSSISVPNTHTTSEIVNIDYQVSSTEFNDEFTVKLLQNNVVVGTQAVTTDYGDSGRFVVNLPSEGNYTFKTVTENNTQGGSKTSATVAVEYDETKPSAAVFGTTVRSGNSYTVNFTAPSNADVEKVVVYASTSNTFDLDDSTKVGEVDVSPSQKTSFTYNAPDSNQRYFAVVAVDDAGNRSAAVGDAEVRTNDTTALATGTEGNTGSQTDSDGDGVIDSLDPEPLNPDVDGTEADDSEGDVASATDETADPATEEGANSIVLTIIVIVAAGLLLTFFRNREIDEA